MNYFDKYVSHYDMNDSNINYKYYHSYRVMKNMEDLALKLKLSPKDVNLAKVIGLLHDIGRFEQNKLYNSFKDDKLDHGEYGVKVLKENNVLDNYEIDYEDYETIYIAIKNHNKFQIATNLTKRQLFFTKLIRDADKLDILHALGEKKYKQYLRQDDRPISKKISTSFFNNKPGNLKDALNYNDSLIITFSYIYDINFKETYKIIYEEKYYDKIYQRINCQDIFFPYFQYTKKYLEKKI